MLCANILIDPSLRFGMTRRFTGLGEEARDLPFMPSETQEKSRGLVV